MNGPADRACFILHVDEDVAALARTAAVVCPNAWRVEAALLELLQNAIEHGNLGFDAAAKRELMASGEWARAVQERARRPGLARRRVLLRRERRDDCWRFEIADEGDGFDPTRVGGVDAPGQVEASGRGLLIAAALVGALRYRDHGRCVGFDVPAD